MGVSACSWLALRHERGDTTAVATSGCSADHAATARHPSNANDGRVTGARIYLIPRRFCAAFAGGARKGAGSARGRGGQWGRGAHDVAGATGAERTTLHRGRTHLRTAG